jgi:hypothetical protein
MATAKKPSKAEKVRAYQAKNPSASAVEVSKATGADVGYIYAIRHSDKNKAAKTPKKDWKTVMLTTSKKAVADKVFELTKGRERRHPVTGKILMQGMPMVEDKVTMVEPPADNVNHPAHYKVGGIETIDFIEAKQLSYHLGNVVKYIARADSKGNRKEDLLKAQWYLNREIANLSK